MKLLAWILALVFAIAAGLKLALMVRGTVGPAGAAETMFGRLPLWGQSLLVAVELLLAVWLAGGWKPRAAAFATITLLSLFLAAIVVEMGQPDPQACGCMGALSLKGARVSLWMTLSLDVLLLLLALWVYFASLRLPQSDKKRDPGIDLSRPE